MNALETLRSADPARGLPTTGLDPAAEQLLRSIVVTSPGPDTARPASSLRSREQRRPLLVTAAVAALVVVGAALVIRAVPAQDANPAATTATRSELEAKLFEVLPAGASTAPALTYTDAEPGARGDGFDTTGRTLYLAAACDGGGSLRITISGSADRTLDCATLSTTGPIDLSAIPSAAKGISVNVTASSGQPHYIAKVAAILNPTPAATQR